MHSNTSRKGPSKIGCETACRYVCVLDTKRDEVIGNRRHKHVILTKVKAYEENVFKLAGFKKTLNSGAHHPVVLAL